MNKQERHELLRLGLRQCGREGVQRLLDYMDAGGRLTFTGSVLNCHGDP